MAAEIIADKNEETVPAVRVGNCKLSRPTASHGCHFST